MDRRNALTRVGRPEKISGREGYDIKINNLVKVGINLIYIHKNRYLNMEVPLELVFDISGEPGKNTYIGLVSFNRNTKDKIIDELFVTYPKIKGKKGSQLQKEDHLKIVNFLNEKKVRMVILNFNKNDWRYHRNKWNNPHDYIIKMCSALYFSLILMIAKRDNRYNITSCVESQVGDIQRVFHFCKKLANSYQMEFDFNFSTGEYNRGIQIADYIAYSLKTFKKKDIENIKFYRIHNKIIPKKVQKSIFV